MDREELMQILRRGPARITMNDGRSFDVPSLEMAVVSDITATVLYKADDGKYRSIHLPLVTMTSIEPIGSEA